MNKNSFTVMGIMSAMLMLSSVNYIPSFFCFLGAMWISFIGFMYCEDLEFYNKLKILRGNGK